MPLRHLLEFRVAYGDTDQMGTYANARALEWFEHGRTELFRAAGLPYREIEARGVYFPVREAKVEYLGRATYDDLLAMTVLCSREGRARLRADITITQSDSGADVCRGYTIHAVVNADGRPIRPPKWLEEFLDEAEQG